MAGMNRIVQALVLASAVLAVYWASGVARAETSQPILGYTQREITTHQGDAFTLQVRLAEGQVASIQWVRDTETLCSQLSCRISTLNWGLGKHHLVVTVTQASDIFFLDYEVTVIKMPLAAREREVSFSMEYDPLPIRRVSPRDFVMRALSGKVFYDDGNSLESLSPAWRSLAWTERLSTGPVSTAHFGLVSTESHILGDQSEVWLINKRSGSDPLSTPAVLEPDRQAQGHTQDQRLIVLLSGTLRSRQLSPKNPDWHILVPRFVKPTRPDDNSAPFYESWLEIQGDQDADILVVRKSLSKGPRKKRGFETEKREVVSIIVVRGTAQVTQITGSQDHVCGRYEQECLAQFIPAGAALTFELPMSHHSSKISGGPRITIPDPELYEPAFSETTPQYLESRQSEAFGPAWSLLGLRRSLNKDTAISQAQENMKKGDFLSVIESMQALGSQLEPAETVHLMLGRAYAGLGLRKAARTHLLEASLLRPDSAEPHLILAHLAMGERRWRIAEQHLKKAEELGALESPWALYYFGVIAHRQGHMRLARREMLSATHAAPTDASGQVSRIFAEDLSRESWLESRVGFGAFYDSQVLRTRRLLDSETDIQTLRVGKAGGAEFSLDLDAFLHKDSESDLAFEFRLEKKSFFDQRLRILDPLHQEIGLKLSLSPILSETAKPLVRFEIHPFMGTDILGISRVSDEIGGQITVKLPTAHGLLAGFKTIMRKDPNPGRNDIFDPNLREVVPPENQSHHIGRLWSGANIYEAFETKIYGEIAGEHWNYDNQRRHAESFRVRSFLFMGQHGLPFDHGLRWEAQFLQRHFDLSRDRRMDHDVTGRLEWTYRYSPLMSQSVGFLVERQLSSRRSQDFSRHSLSYKIYFDL